MQIIKRLVFGMVAGFMATAVMEKAMKWMYQPSPSVTSLGNESAPQTAARQAGKYIPGVPDPEETKLPMASAMHWSYGMMWGALYGLFAPWQRLVRRYAGTAYGAFVWAVGDEVIPVALRLSPPPQNVPVSTHISAAGAHVVFGAVTAIAFRGLYSEPTRTDRAKRRALGWRDRGGESAERAARFGRQRVESVSSFLPWG